MPFAFAMPQVSDIGAMAKGNKRPKTLSGVSGRVGNGRLTWNKVNSDRDVEVDLEPLAIHQCVLFCHFLGCMVALSTLGARLCFVDASNNLFIAR